MSEAAVRRAHRIVDSLGPDVPDARLAASAALLAAVHPGKWLVMLPRNIAVVVSSASLAVRLAEKHPSGVTRVLRIAR